jgi:hypothetical protein
MICRSYARQQFAASAISREAVLSGRYTCQ